jgi:hypothetical protein
MACLAPEECGRVYQPHPSQRGSLANLVKKILAESVIPATTALLGILVAANNQV